jgi:hypothetical protein
MNDSAFVFDADAPTSVRALHELVREGKRAKLLRLAHGRTAAAADLVDRIAEAVARVCDPDRAPWDPSATSFVVHFARVMRGLECAQPSVAAGQAADEESAKEIAEDAGDDASASGRDPAERRTPGRRRRLGARLTRALAADAAALRILELRGAGLKVPDTLAQAMGGEAAGVYEAERRIQVAAQRVVDEDRASPAEGADPVEESSANRTSVEAQAQIDPAVAWQIAAALLAEAKEIARVEALTDEQVAQEVRALGLSVPSTEALLARAAKRARARAKPERRRGADAGPRARVSEPRAEVASGEVHTGYVVVEPDSPFRPPDVTAASAERPRVYPRAQGRDGEEARRPARAKRRWRLSWLFAAAATSAVVGFAVFVARPATAGRDDARATRADDAGSMLVERAARLRDEAAAACDSERFEDCQTALDHAMLTDPGGEREPRVVEMRGAIRKDRVRSASSRSSSSERK